MRPPEQVKREFLRQWLAKAEEDLAVARELAGKHGLYPNAVGFHAQQAAEKFLKAFLVAVQVEFPKTHDLAQLLDLIVPLNPNMASALRGSTVLTDYAVRARYPEPGSPAGPEDAERAIALASQVREAVLAAVGELEPPTG